MKLNCSALLVALIVVAAISAYPYPVGPALTLEKLADESDIIFKGTVVSTQPVKDDWFKPVQGFAAYETEFRIVTVLKGSEHESLVHFRHYDEAKDIQQFGMTFMPQYYHFEPKQAYIVFARKSENEVGRYRQLWPNHKIKGDQGVLRCPDERPVAKNPLKKCSGAN
jgi:hypothetical protein